MPFDHTLLAVSRKDGHYMVHSMLPNAYLHLEKVQMLVNVDVSKDNIFRDFVAPMAVWQAKRCLPDRPDEAQRIDTWLDGLPESVYFVLMHSAEFETSYGD